MDTDHTMESAGNVNSLNKNSGVIRKLKAVAFTMLFLLAGMVVIGHVAVGVAKAQGSKTFWGWQGYLGNGTIYFTTDEYQAHMVNWSSVAQSNSSAPYGVGNALNFSLGTPGDKDGSSYYVYNPNSRDLGITFYLGADGGSNRTLTYNPVDKSLTPVYVYQQETAVSVGNIPSSATGVTAKYAQSYDRGINETQTSTGKTQQFIDNMILHALGYLPVVGFVVNTYGTMQTVITYITPSSTSNAAGPGTAYDIFDITGGGVVNKYNIWQNVFAQGINVTVLIPQQWWSYTPRVSLAAQNIINGLEGAAGENSAAGAATYMNYTTTSDTAALDGRVFGAGGSTALSGFWLKIVNDANGTTYYVKTAADGSYSFFGTPDTQYTISASMGTPWGTASYSTTTTTGNAGSSDDNSIHLADQIHGQVTDANNGKPIGNAAVHITAPNGVEHTFYTNSNGYYSTYTSITGTYSLYATFDGYTSSTYYADVAAKGNNYQVNIQIGIPSGGCVLTGTMVYLTNHSAVPVQELNVGESVLSYNILAGAFSRSDIVNATITSITVSHVHHIMDINNGLLFVSGLFDQPLYTRVQNGTAEPVLLGMLNTTMELYDAMNNTWIPITHLEYLRGNFTVYDVVTSSPFALLQPSANNYITGVGVPSITKKP